MPIMDRLRASLLSEGELVKYTVTTQIELSGEGISTDFPLEIVVTPYGDGDDTYVANIDARTLRHLPVPLKTAAYALTLAFVEHTVPAGDLAAARDHNDGVRFAGNAVSSRFDD